MRTIGNTIAPLLVVTLASLAYARVPARDAAPASVDLMSGAAVAAQQDDSKPKQDDAKPNKQDDAKPKQTPDAKPPRAENREMPGKQQKADKDQKQDNNQARNDRKEDRQQAGGHGRIPDDKFREHFGQTHTFTVRTVVTTTRVIPNQTRFVYSGYSFVFVDPWPGEWALTDNCYIDFIDGEYFIINPVHPGVRVALMIVG